MLMSSLHGNMHLELAQQADDDELTYYVARPLDF